MTYKSIIKTFEFTNENRSKIDLTGGLRLNAGRAAISRPRLGLPPDPTDASKFVTTTGLYAKTWLTNPNTVKRWTGFQVDIDHVKDEVGAVISIERYRISLNGVDELWWDGANWSTPGATDWSTEGDVASNLDVIIPTTQSIQIIINLETPTKDESPRIRAIKVLYESDIEFHEDYVTRSLVPELKETIRPIARVLLIQRDTGLTFFFDTSDIQTPYDVVDLDTVYDEDADPNHLVDLLDSYDAASKTATLNQSVAAGVKLRVNFTYRLQVAVRTSRDFIEVEKVPAIFITDVNFVNTREIHSDYVLNVDTGDGVRLERGKMRDIVFLVSVFTDKLVDYQRLTQEIVRRFTDDPQIRSRGLDEEFDVLIDEQPNMLGSPTSKDRTNGQLRIRIINAVFYERGSAIAFGVKNFILGGNPRSGYQNPSSSIC